VSRDEAAYIADMVEACARVMEYTRGLDAASLRSDRKTVDAVVRNLEIVGEAAKRVSPPLRSRVPQDLVKTHIRLREGVRGGQEAVHAGL
jgi:uncharacterized protein with HEPN domain